MQALLDYGGPILWLQAGLAFFALVFVVERLLYFHGVRINAAEFLLGLANHARRKAFAEAIHEASRVPGPVARVAVGFVVRGVHYEDGSQRRGNGIAGVLRRRDSLSRIEREQTDRDQSTERKER